MVKGQAMALISLDKDMSFAEGIWILNTDVMDGNFLLQHANISIFIASNKKTQRAFLLCDCSYLCYFYYS